MPLETVQLPALCQSVSIAPVHSTVFPATKGWAKDFFEVEGGAKRATNSGKGFQSPGDALRVFAAGWGVLGAADAIPDKTPINSAPKKEVLVKKVIR